MSIWQPGPRPEWVQALNDNCDPDWIPLDADALLSEARAKTGLEDFGDPRFEQPFRILVESLTDEIEDAAMALIERVDELGGAVAAIEEGFQKSEIENSAYRVAQEIDAGDRVVVGVNKYTSDGDEHYDPMQVDMSIEADQVARLTALKADRDNDEVERLLGVVRDVAAGEENLLYPMRDALRARATVGEVSDALRDVWGTYQPKDAF